MKTSELLESEDDFKRGPLWARIVARRIDQKKPVYFAAARQAIEKITASRTLDSELIVLHLVRLREDGTPRMSDGQPLRQTYTVWPNSYDQLTLSPYKDGLRLHFIQDAKKVIEGVNPDGSKEPVIIVALRRAIELGKTVRLSITHRLPSGDINVRQGVVKSITWKEKAFGLPRTLYVFKYVTDKLSPEQMYFDTWASYNVNANSVQKDIDVREEDGVFTIVNTRM